MKINGDVVDALNNATRSALGSTDQRVGAMREVFSLYSNDRWRVMIGRSIKIACLTAILVSLICRVKC